MLIRIFSIIVILATTNSVLAQYIGGNSGIYNLGQSSGSNPPACSTCILAENSNFIISESSDNLVVE